jgi:hypothetical protein
MKFKSIKIGTPFQFEQNGAVFVRVRGGCKPGCGGVTYKIDPETTVIIYQP